MRITKKIDFIHIIFSLIIIVLTSFSSSSSSEYLKPLCNYPKNIKSLCTSSNEGKYDYQHVQIINDKNDNEKDINQLINNPNKTIFCIEPGNYHKYGVINVIESGESKEKPKYVILNNGNDKHPGEMIDSNDGDGKMMIADIRMKFVGVSYWVVDRMACLNQYWRECFEIVGGSHDIILNRLYAMNYSVAVTFRATVNEPYTRDNTVQNSRFDQMSRYAINRDNVAILVRGINTRTNGSCLNSHIINNEVRNANDAIQLLVHPENNIFRDYSGTVIDGNHLYIDKEMYTDGNGNLNPGKPLDGVNYWAFTENAIDIKMGGDDPNNPLIISNNYMWGWRRTDQNGGGSGSWGDAVVIHNYVKNLIITNNVIFDSNRGIGVSSLTNGKFEKNIIYDIGFQDYNTIAAFFYNVVNFTVEKNIIYPKHKNLGTRWIAFNGGERLYEVKINVAMDSSTRNYKQYENTTIENNYHYNTTRREETDGTYYSGVEEAKHRDLTFTTDIFTNNPRKITLEGVLPTKNSPHAIDYPDFLNMIKEESPKRIGLVVFISIISALFFIVIFIIVVIALIYCSFFKGKNGKGDFDDKKLLEV